MFIEITYYSPKFNPRGGHGKKLTYYHQQINLSPDIIKWMVNSYETPLLLERGDTIVPNTRMFVEGLGVVYVKQKRTEIKQMIAAH